LDQSVVRRFLSDPATHSGPVEVIETHASVIFLAGDTAWKMKKAVTYPYLDYGTLDRRKQFCAEEVRINRRTAPDLYLDPVPVTETAGELVIGGDGKPVEWLVPMRRFDNDLLLDRMAERDELSPALCRDIADAIHAFHVAAEPERTGDAAAALQAISSDIISELRRHGGAVFEPPVVDELEREWRALLTRTDGLIRERQRNGLVRHLHGDLHLRNIVLWQGRPTLFDAIEFDPAIATIDTLYDLAFLLMDLLHRDRKDEANAIMNRYLQRCGDYEGLALLSLFLSLRAAIRAHTGASGATDDAQRREAAAYLDLARSVLKASDPVAIAIGGPSGSGKSTTAALIAPEIGGAAGAVIIRSDVVRKRLHGVAPEEKLNPGAYTAAKSRRVFETLAAEAETILKAGQSVIIDAVFGGDQNLAPFEAGLRQLGIGMTGYWLDAPADALRQRVAARRNDASDADVTVLGRQLGSVQCPAGWQVVDASGSPEESASNLRRALLRPAAPPPRETPQPPKPDGQQDHRRGSSG